MTRLLREALNAAPSMRRVSIEANVARGSLIRFARGEQSLRLDKADRLAAYFGIRCIGPEHHHDDHEKGST